MKDRVLMGPTLFERQAKVGGNIFYLCKELVYLDIPKILITLSWATACKTAKL